MKFQRSTYQRSEDDLRSEFYHRARLAGLELYLEVPLPSTIHRSGQMRADAVVVGDDNEIVCCVEFKAEGRQAMEDSRQKNAYRGLEYQYGVPTLWVTQFAQIDPAIVRIQQLSAALTRALRRRMTG